MSAAKEAVTRGRKTKAVRDSANGPKDQCRKHGAADEMREDGGRHQCTTIGPPSGTRLANGDYVATRRQHSRARRADHVAGDHLPSPSTFAVPDSIAAFTAAT